MVSVLFITFVICLFIGVPVAFSLGLASLAYFLGANMPIATFSQRFFAGIDSFTLLCIPGFTLAGNLMNQGGISDKLMDFCDKLVGHLTGGMAYANIMASMIFAGISGTALSDTVALGGIEIPMMLFRGSHCCLQLHGPHHSALTAHDHGRHHDRPVRIQDVHGRHCSRHPDGRRHGPGFLCDIQEEEIPQTGTYEFCKGNP